MTGLVSAAVAIGVGQLVAGMVDPSASPVIAVGQGAIDLTPEWLKAFAIRTFGERDKDVLLAGIVVVAAVIAAVLGVASLRRPWVAVAGIGAFGAVGVVAAITRPEAEPMHALPAIAAAVAGVLMFGVLRARPIEDPERPAAPAWGMDRRRFLLTGAAGAVAAVAAGGLGNLFARRFRVDESRAAVRIPSPSSLAPTVAGTELGVPGVEPFLTPNDRFYRVDTALFVPALMAEDWHLRVHGMVEREIELDYPALLSRPLIERDITLTCVSNEVGGPYAGNARWVGARLKDLLEEAAPLPGADQLVSRSVDGFTIGTPTAIAMDGRDAMLAVSMNGEPLPLDHGFPVRMVVPGLYGYVSAMKWVVELD